MVLKMALIGTKYGTVLIAATESTERLHSDLESAESNESGCNVYYATGSIT